MKTKNSFYSKIFLYSFVAFLIIFWSILSFGYEWSKTFGGSEWEHGNSVQQTADGGFIIAGTTRSFGAGNLDVYLIKTDGSGNEQWSKTFGGKFINEGFSVQQTADGGFIIAGSAADANSVYLIKTDGSGIEQWSKTFGGSGGDAAGISVQQTADGGFIIAGWTTHLSDYGDVYLIKTDGSGIEQWSKTFGGSGGGAAGTSVQQTTDGGFIIAGWTDSFSAPWVDVYLIKTDGSGIEQWSKTFGGSGNDFGFSVQQTADGGFIVAGMTNSLGAGRYDVYLIKTDGSGIEQWSKTFGGSGGDAGESVQQTTDGGFIIAGDTESFGAGKSDVYLIKTDSSGNEQWSKTFGGSEWDYGNSVQQTADGGFIIAGWTSSFGAGEGAVYLIYYKPDDFADVPPGYWAEDAIYKIYAAGITKGCCQDPLMYCPENTVTRDQMAVFLGRATHDSNFTPPDATGIFADVPAWYWAADWIEQFYADGLTKGCKIDPHDLQSPVIYYCPKYPVTRTTMAIFLLRAKHGANYQPPPATGIFGDVWVNYWAAGWIEQLYKEKITVGCKKNPLMYCPETHVTRSQMAVFLARMIGL